MELNLLNEEISLWDGDLLLGDPFSHIGVDNRVNAKLPGLVRLDIADQGTGITLTQVDEFKPGLDDFPSELFQNFNQQLPCDCTLHDWMLEKFDFNFIDDIMNTGDCMSDFFNLEEFGFNDAPNTPKSDLQPTISAHTIGISELTPPVSPEGSEINELNNTLQPEQFNLKHIGCKCVLESLVEHCRNPNCTSDILHTPPLSPELTYSNEIDTHLISDNGVNSPELTCSNEIDTSVISDKGINSPELNYSNKISPDTSFSSNQSVNSSSFSDSSPCNRQLKKTSNRNRKSADSSNCKARTSILKKGYPGIKKDRKRSQNRTAATRYRIKKRGELCDLQQQCDVEETRNKELKTKISEISREVNYLKDLMKEIIQSKRSKI